MSHVRPRALLLVMVLLLAGSGFWILTGNSSANSTAARRKGQTAVPLPVFTPTGASDDEMWEDINEAEFLGRRVAPLVGNHRTIKLNTSLLQRVLDATPMEFTEAAREGTATLTLPMPNGTFERFNISESPIMEPELAAKFPEIKTYIGQGIDDPAATMRFDWTPQGFHALVLSEKHDTVAVHPLVEGDKNVYVSYFNQEFQEKNARAFTCLVSEEEQEAAHAEHLRSQSRFQANQTGGTLRRYRIAVAATGEYTQTLGGGTVSGALSSINTWVNSATAIYERDLAVRLILVANNDQIIFTNPGTDPYTGNGTTNSSGSLINENPSVLNGRIGSANYDIGHVLGGGGGGVAQLSSVCGTNKSRGVTLMRTPVGNTFDLGVFCHEMGHQYGCTHTFNDGSASNCAPNRSASTSWEPGSGSTIMSYAGICGTNGNIVSAFNLQFHSGSYSQATAFVSGTGATCSSNLTTGNSAPTANAGPDYTIPRNTPFTLTGSGSDPNGDALTYCWEQLNPGTATSPPFDDADGQQRPNFRTFPPVSSPSRTFPQLSDILNNVETRGESLPRIGRTLTMRLTARDNRAGGGGSAFDTASITVAAAAGPFRVTAPNTAVTLSGTTTVTWDVAGTNVAPVNTANVNILLSTDGGNTFPTVLASNTPNDGSQAVTLPNITTSTARIRIEAVGNVYFDLSNVNFSIQPAPTCTFSISPTSASVASGGGTGSISVTTSAGCAWSATSNASFITITAGASGSGSGTVSYSVAANTATTSRTGTITAAGQTFTVTQAAASGTGDFSLSLLRTDGTDGSTGVWTRGGQFQRDVIVTRTGGFTGAVTLSLQSSRTGLFTSVTASQQPITGTSSRLTFTVSSTVATGPATVTIIGTDSTGRQRSTTLSLTIN